jgi:hypothetical protein
MESWRFWPEVLMTYNVFMLSELQRKVVWENWISSEIRANYFADMGQRAQSRQKFFTWLMLLFSSGAVLAVVTDRLPAHWGWVRTILPLLTGAISILLLVQQNQKCATDCSDLHFRWNRLASACRALWNDMYSDDAASKFDELEEAIAEASKSSMSIPYKKNVMAKWQAHVERHLGNPATA